MTVVLGASGTGKPSVVTAGLLPALRAARRGGWTVLPPLRPGKSPLAALAALTLPWRATPVAFPARDRIALDAAGRIVTLSLADHVEPSRHPASAVALFTGTTLDSAAETRAIPGPERKGRREALERASRSPPPRRGPWRRALWPAGVLVFWCAYWLRLARWPRLLVLLRRDNGWPGVVLLGLFLAIAWGLAEAPRVVVRGRSLPAVVEKLVFVALLLGLAGICGWLRMRRARARRPA